MNWLNLPKPILALAPMADITDSPFGRICRRVSSGAGFVIFREMASSEAITRGNEKTLRRCAFQKEERPIVLQLFGSDPEILARAAAAAIEKFRPDGLDINMGCPARKISGRAGAGAALMKDHRRAAALARAVKKEIGATPLSVKTRLGWENDKEILVFAPRLESAGVDALIIHGRTKKQGYAGRADWQRIGEVKKALAIPVIANGDIASAADFARCLEISGADGAMVGRAALGNPWIFSEIISGRKRPEKNELVEAVFQHARWHLEFYGPERGLVSFRKHLLSYFKGFSGAKKLRPRLGTVENIVDMENALLEIN